MTDSECLAKLKMCRGYFVQLIYRDSGGKGTVLFQSSGEDSRQICDEAIRLLELRAGQPDRAAQALAEYAWPK